jgi:hypothetical protein
MKESSAGAGARWCCIVARGAMLMRGLYDMSIVVVRFLLLTSGWGSRCRYCTLFVVIWSGCDSDSDT